MMEKAARRQMRASILLVAVALSLTWVGVAVRCRVPQVTAGDWTPANATRPGQVCHLQLRAAGGLKAPSTQLFHCMSQTGWEVRWPLCWRCTGLRFNGLAWQAEMTAWPVVREPLDKALWAIYLPSRLELHSPEYVPVEQTDLQPIWSKLPEPSVQKRHFSRLWAIPVFLYALWRLLHWLSPKQRAWRRVRAANTPQELHEALLFFRSKLANELGESMLNRVDELRFAPVPPTVEDIAAVKALALHLVSGDF
ncbi:MAG: hypothetical protein IJJ33_09690 [Victivallales bacterium]|nr:hypothetical protein [Victivallales bacterium]